MGGRGRNRIESLMLCTHCVFHRQVFSFIQLPLLRSSVCSLCTFIHLLIGSIVLLQLLYSHCCLTRSHCILDTNRPLLVRHNIIISFCTVLSNKNKNELCVYFS